MALRVPLIGNRDAHGKAKDNRLVVLGRARVAAQLTKLGLPREALSIEIRGANSPVATNDTPQGENRHVDIELLPKH